MGIMDKVKSQVGVLAEKAQEGARVGQERLSDLQAKRQADALLLELGGLAYLSRAGREPAGAAARTEELVAQLQAVESAHGPIRVTSAVADPPPGGSFVPPGAGSGAASATGTEASPSDPAAPPGTAAPSGPAAPSGTAAPSGPAGGIPTASYRSDETEA